MGNDVFTSSWDKKAMRWKVDIEGKALNQIAVFKVRYF